MMTARANMLRERVMRYLEKKLRAGLIALMGVLLLAGCGRAEDLRVEQ